jgi:O-antigen ligase
VTHPPASAVRNAVTVAQDDEPQARAALPLRLALHVVQLGAVAAVLAVGTWHIFELDRFFVPKELVLHATAFIGGLLAARAFGRGARTRADVLLVAFLALSAASALFATNGWNATRALAVSTSGVALFWTARALRGAGLGRPLIVGLAAAVMLAACTSLVQAYGITSDFFSVNRAPGGTLGNRNFVAHVAAFGLPLVLFAALSARRRATFLFFAAGAALVAATLVLTRSRAGWLAFAAALIVFVAGVFAAAPLRRSRRTRLRLGTIALLAAVCTAGAVVLPNALRWRAENPYLESMRALADHREGSGRGRLIQYEQSLRMTASHPALGVGPGNWAVVYPAHAPANDPSLSGRSPGMTSNPWPSSDWIAITSERGPLAALLILAALLVFAWRALRTLFRWPNGDEALAATTLLAVLAAAMVAGAFDAVLLLALPTLLFWTALGALLPLPPPAEAAAPAGRSRFQSGAALLTLALLAGLATVRSSGSAVAMHIHDTRDDIASLRRAAAWDPGNYRLRVRLARSIRERAERCEHARAAVSLYPQSRTAQQLSRRCG